MAVKNSTILQRAWIEGSNDFQQRIPNPEIAGYENVVRELFSIQNNDLLNSFTGMLNGLNMTYIEGKRFNNPLRDIVIKGEDPWGNGERHVAVKYLQAHCGIPNDETLLKLEMPEVVEWYLSNSTPRRYEFSWPRNQYMRAFARDGFGYDDLLATTFDQAYSSDAYDEMQIMIEQFGIADELAGGLYREVLTNDPTTEAGAKELLQKARAIAGRMKFPTMLYNHIDVPVFESPETLVLWVTPEALSFIDVYALAYVFQLDKADVQYRIIEIPEFPIPNVYAALTSEDFIYGRDAQYGLEPAFYNPAQQAYKHYLFHQERIGINPAANCVLFTYGEDEEEPVIPTITIHPTTLAFTPSTGEIAPGGKLQTKLALTGTGAVANIAVEPDAAFYDVAISRTSGNDTVAVPTNSATYVDNYGILHLQKTGVLAGDIVTVTATSAYINPSGDNATPIATFTATVVSRYSVVQGAKECPVAVNPYIEYTDTTEEATASE